MIDFLWQFFFNLKIPMTVMFVLVALVGSIIIYDTRNAIRKIRRTDEEYPVLDWRIWTSVNVICVFAILWLLVQATPSPTFKREYVTQYKDRVVERKIVQVRWRDGKEIVYKVPTYDQAYKLCQDEITSGPDSAQTCHRIATEASLPLPRVLTRTMYMRDPYDVAFKGCMDKLNVTGHYLDKADAATCQSIAMHRPIEIPKPKKETE